MKQQNLLCTTIFITYFMALLIEKQRLYPVDKPACIPYNCYVKTKFLFENRCKTIIRGNE